MGVEIGETHQDGTTDISLTGEELEAAKYLAYKAIRITTSDAAAVVLLTAAAAIIEQTKGEEN